MPPPDEIPQTGDRVAPSGVSGGSKDGSTDGVEAGGDPEPDPKRQKITPPVSADTMQDGSDSDSEYVEEQAAEILAQDSSQDESLHDSQDETDEYVASSVAAATNGQGNDRARHPSQSRNRGRADTTGGGGGGATATTPPATNRPAALRRTPREGAKNTAERLKKHFKQAEEWSKKPDVDSEDDTAKDDTVVDTILQITMPFPTDATKDEPENVLTTPADVAEYFNVDVGKLLQMNKIKSETAKVETPLDIPFDEESGTPYNQNRSEWICDCKDGREDTYIVCNCCQGRTHISCLPDRDAGFEPWLCHFCDDVRMQKNKTMHKKKVKYVEWLHKKHREKLAPIACKAVCTDGSRSNSWAKTFKDGSELQGWLGADKREVLRKLTTGTEITLAKKPVGLQKMAKGTGPVDAQCLTWKLGYVGGDNIAADDDRNLGGSDSDDDSDSDIRHVQKALGRMKANRRGLKDARKEIAGLKEEHQKELASLKEVSEGHAAHVTLVCAHVSALEAEIETLKATGAGSVSALAQLRNEIQNPEQSAKVELEKIRANTDLAWGGTPAIHKDGYVKGLKAALSKFENPRGGAAAE